MLRTRLVGLAGVFAAALLSGCKQDAVVPKENAATAPGSARQYVAKADAGTITGVISFKGKAPAGTIDTSMDPACSLGSASGTLPVEQFAVKSGKLANVFLYVKSGPAEAMQAGPVSTAGAVMDQKNCRYVPHVVGVVAGGSVEFLNSDPTMHNIHTMPAVVGNEAVDVSQGPRGAPQTKQFNKPETMLPVRCNNHPWMNAFINVSATPFFAVSDEAGKFTITGLPPGDYVLGAVQEKLGEKTLQVTVPAKGAAKADFSFGL